MLLSFAHHLGVDSFSLLWTQTVADVSCILGFSDYSNEQSDSNITVCVSMTVFDAWGQKALTVYIYIYLAFIFIQSNSQVRNTLGGAEGWCGLEFELATLQLKGDPPAPELQLPPNSQIYILILSEKLNYQVFPQKMELSHSDIHQLQVCSPSSRTLTLTRIYHIYLSNNYY